MAAKSKDIPKELSVFILAGGAGTSGSFDRTKLRWTEGRTLLASIEAQFEAFSPEVIREDLIRGLGPLGGIYTGLKSSKTTWSLFLSCDMPFLTLETLRHLWDLAQADKDARVCLFTREKPEPFPSLVHKDFLMTLQAHLRKGELDHHHLSREPGVCFFPFDGNDAAREFFSIETPADYSEACKMAKIEPDTGTTG